MAQAFPSECQDDTELLRGRGRQSALRREFEGVARHPQGKNIVHRNSPKHFDISFIITPEIVLFFPFPNFRECPVIFMTILVCWVLEAKTLVQNQD